MTTETRDKLLERLTKVGYKVRARDDYSGLSGEKTAAIIVERKAIHMARELVPTANCDLMGLGFIFY